MQLEQALISKADFNALAVRNCEGTEQLRKIKFDREFGRRYMLVEELMKDEYNAGKAEGIEALVKVIVGFLSDLAPVPDNLKSRIAAIDDLEVLTSLSKKAARAASIDEFERELTAQNY